MGLSKTMQQTGLNKTTEEMGSNKTMERDKQMELIERIMGPSKTNGQASLTWGYNSGGHSVGWPSASAVKRTSSNLKCYGGGQGHWATVTVMASPGAITISSWGILSTTTKLIDRKSWKNEKITHQHYWRNPIITQKARATHIFCVQGRLEVLRPILFFNQAG